MKKDDNVMVAVRGGFQLCTVLKSNDTTLTVRSKHEPEAEVFEVAATTNGYEPTDKNYEPTGCDFHRVS